MSGFLLDTNTVRAWFDSGHSAYLNVRAAISAVPDGSPLYVSAITRGEIYFGHAYDGDDAFRQKYRTWVDKEFPQELSVTNLTARIYGRVRGELCRKCAPPGGWTRKKRAEQLTDPVAGGDIGIDENDLWLASQALERNLVLVTADKLKPIRDAILRLIDDEFASYSTFTIANWCKHPLPPPTPHASS